MTGLAPVTNTRRRSVRSFRVEIGLILPSRFSADRRGVLPVAGWAVVDLYRGGEMINTASNWVKLRLEVSEIGFGAGIVAGLFVRGDLESQTRAIDTRGGAGH